MTATAVAVFLHLALLSLWQRPPPRVRAPAPWTAPTIPVTIFRIPRAAAAQAPAVLGKRAPALRPGRRGTVPAEVHVAEREIIDQGNGVTMTIEGAPPAPPPPEPPKEWLRMDVWVAPPVITPPHPGEYCVPGQPSMPDRAIDHEVTGRVTASYLVDADGVALDVELEPGAPPVLARAVRDWLHGCVFVPAQQGGKRTTARVKQSFLFEIR